MGMRGVVLAALIQIQSAAAVSLSESLPADLPALAADVLTENDSRLLARTPGAAGPDVTKKLPSVEAVMSKAKEQLSDFAKEKTRVEIEVARKQVLRKRVLESWKVKYEKQLAEQVSSVKDIMSLSEAMKARQDDLESRNEAIRDSIKNIRKSNNLMREVLAAFSPKMTMAHEFMLDTLNLTDDAQALAMGFLQEAERAKNAEDSEPKMDVTSTELSTAAQIEQAIRARLRNGNEAVTIPKAMLLQTGSGAGFGLMDEEALELDPSLFASLLQLGSRLPKSNELTADEAFGNNELMGTVDVSSAQHEQIIKAFGDGDQALADADEENTAAAKRLKAEFAEKSKKVSAVKDKLLVEQGGINATCQNLEDLGKDLLTAKDFLMLQGHNLAEDLTALKGIMQTVDKAATEVLDTAPLW